MLSLVERGWSAARQCSLRLTAQGQPVIHLVKGRLDHSIRQLIVLQPGERFVVLPRNLFRPVAWGLIASCAIARRVRWVLVDNERTLAELSGWCRRIGIVPVLVRQHREVELVIDGAVREFQDAFRVT